MSNIAVLARKVTDLAIRRILRVTWGVLAANIGIKMGFSAGAVAISRHGLVVNVIDWRSTQYEPSKSRGTQEKDNEAKGLHTERPKIRGWETIEVDVKVHAGPIASGCPRDIATDGGCILVREDRGVCHTGGVAFDDLGGTQCTGCAWNWKGSVDHREPS